MPLIDRDDSVLVVVDAQPGFFATGADAVVERIAWLVGAAAQLAVPVVVTEEDPDRNEATDARIVQRLAPGTPVLTKPAFGLAACEDIVAAIGGSGRRTIVLAGFETDVCVAQSAIGLVELGLRAVVLEDATATDTDRAHQLGLARMFAAGVERNHCKGLLFEWLRTVEEGLAQLEVATKALGPPPWAP